MAFRSPAPNHRVKDLPDGISLLGRAIDTYRSAHDAASTARAAEEVALARLRELVAAGECNASCTDEHGSAHVSAPEPPPRRIPNSDRGPYNPIDDTSVATPFRVGFYLWDVGFDLDYQACADRIYGPGLPFQTAKNRLSTHLSKLRSLGVVRPEGRNWWEVDPERLSELTGFPLITFVPGD